MKTLFQVVARNALRAASNTSNGTYRQRASFHPSICSQVRPQGLHQHAARPAQSDMELTHQLALLWRNMGELLKFQHDTKAMLADLHQRLSDLEAGEGLYLAPKKAALRSGRQPPTGPEIVRMVPDPHPNQ